MTEPLPPKSRLIAPALFILPFGAAMALGAMETDLLDGVLVSIDRIGVFSLVVLHWRKRPDTSGLWFALLGFGLGISPCFGTALYFWYTARWHGLWPGGSRSTFGQRSSFGSRSGSSSSNSGSSQSSGSGSGGSFGGGSSGGGGSGSSWS